MDVRDAPTALHQLRQLRAPLVLVAAALVAVAVASTGVLGPVVQLWVVDLVELACATAATVSSGHRARACRGRLRAAWLWLALGCGGWAAGQAVWSVYELLLQSEVPAPSLADVGYLTFPVAAVVGLSLLPDPGHGRDRDRRLLDGVTVVVALTVVAWTTTLGAVLDAGGDSWAALAVALAYPASDVVLLTVAVLALAQGSGDRTALVMVSLGLVAMSLSDSAFAYGTAVGSYGTGLADLGWCSAFALIALAGVLRPPADAGPRPRPRGGSALPYVTLVAAGAVALRHLLVVDGRAEPMLVWLVALLVALVLLRQWTVVMDNRQLLAVVAERERQLRHQAFHDDLTGLANRALFGERLAAGLSRSRHDGEPLAVAFLDLDGFKAVNDALGHSAGDELLEQVADRLRATLRADDVLARFGGDEFAVLLEHCDAAGAERLGEALLSALRAPFPLSARSVVVSVSVGLAVHPGGSPVPDVDELLAAADVAMYDVKRRGKNGVRLHAPGLRLAEADDLALHAALRRALEDREVRAVFQPVVELDTGRVVGLEALARWRHDGRDVPPPVFVGVAERTGLSSALTGLMLDSALTEVARLRARPGGSDVVVAINVSPGELIDQGLPGRVAAALARHGVPGTQLLVEVTETGLMVDLPRARAVLDGLRELGVEASLDDFGTGYSSLSQLVQLPLHSVKVDREFVRDVDTDPARRRFLEGVLALTEHIGLPVVAEGIERPGQLDVLRAVRCAKGQGYLLGRPCDAAALPPLPPAREVEPERPPVLHAR